MSAISNNNVPVNLPSLAELSQVVSRAAAAPKGDSVQQSTAKPVTIASLERPFLPAGSSQDPQTLTILAAAFVEIFQALANSAQTATDIVAQQQQLNQIQSSVVLATTTNSINQQQNAINTYNKIQAKEEALKPVMIFLSVICAVAMIALVVGTVVSGALTGGATEAAVPEELELMSTGDEAMGTASEAEAAPASEMTDISDEAASSDDEAPVEVKGGDMALDFEADEVDQGLQVSYREILGNSAEDAATDAPAETKTFGQKAAKLLQEAIDARRLSPLTKAVIGMTGSALFATPSLISGIGSLQVGNLYANLANAQTNIGGASAEQSLQTQIFQVMQSAMQRSSSVATQEASGANGAFETFSDIMSAYQQISSGAGQVS